MRTKRTLLNMIFSVISLVISSILSMLLTRTVLLHLGSDYNGLNGTITQFLTVLMLFESGFTVAALVKLYKPFGDDDYQEINKIISKTAQKFRQIGLLMFLVGIAAAAVYILFIKTDVEYAVVLAMFSFSVASTAFNFAYTYKFRLMFQVSQKEYIIYFINIIQYLIMYGGMILIVNSTKNIVFARAFYFIMNVLSGFAVGICAKKSFPKTKYNAECQGVKIEGTRDLLISKIVGILYSSLTFFYMSTFVGTLQTSIYAVYNSVMSIVHNFTNVALNAPQNALGQIINTEKEKLKKTLNEYEYASTFLTCVLLSATMALYIPFVRIYTNGVTDVDYIQPKIALLLVLITISQMIHIPSGKCIELSGKFKIAKRIQMVTLVLLAVFSAVGAISGGLIGLLLAKLATNVILAIMEIGYTHIKIAKGSLTNYLLTVLPNVAIAAIISFAEYRVLLDMNMNLFMFLVAGVIVVVVNSMLLLLFGLIFYPKLLKQLFIRAKKIIISK